MNDHSRIGYRLVHPLLSYFRRERVLNIYIILYNLYNLHQTIFLKGLIIKSILKRYITFKLVHTTNIDVI